MPNEADTATAYLGLGSNLGDRLAALRAAVFAMDSHPQIRVDFETGTASLYETAPVGGPSDQGPFFNSAVRVTTTLTPMELLRTVLSIEESSGRVRRQRWEARVIDIDLLLYEDLATDDRAPSVPHPRLHKRRFVLEPLAEIACDIIHPVLKLTIADLARRCRAGEPAEWVVLVGGPRWPFETPAAARNSPVMGPSSREESG
ncbi:MAG: 2-amino-4-hydroxy-6-hydroxymethyldihydropteridine diphosphokinase [Phycisphaerales bacterium]|nr:MAG: 2-amino-4-hydroxy-6-hydroxymethyldihydropteridine diphosphokinase [Phycisphaerales bacterium]